MPDLNEGDIAVTTTEVLERRHLVKPYESAPVVELRQGAVACPFCGNENFRRSRFRFTDLLEFFMFRLPVRCTRCSQRQYLPFVMAMLSYPAKVPGARVSRGQETWSNWTSADAPVQVARPLSTAMEPKARRLEETLKPKAAPAPRPRPPQETDNGIW